MSSRRHDKQATPLTTLLWRLFRIGASLLVFAPGLNAGAEKAEYSQTVTLRLQDWEARIIPEKLEVFARAEGSSREMLVGTSADKTYSVSEFKKDSTSLRWFIPELQMNVEVAARGNHLQWRFASAREMKFTWPVTSRDPEMSALIYPDGEGLYIPLGDHFWRERFHGGSCRDAHGGLSMPFWGFQAAGLTVTYLAVTDLQTEVCVAEEAGRLYTYAVHDFRQRDGYPPYDIAILLGGNSPIAPAVEYKKWLIDSGRYVSLGQKMAENPEVAKLLGATHAYLYGDGRSVALLGMLQEYGLDRFWLGYDQDPRNDKHLVTEEFIAKAKELGFLVGPYDAFTNIQDPGTADAPNAIWDLQLYETGCIIDQDGKRRPGFGGRGCELSSEALVRAESTKAYVEKRVRKHLRTGINSYFLDVDAAGELFDDYSRDHPMTPHQDRLNRLKRMRHISSEQRMVLGSESVAAWAAPVVHFSHGTHSVHNDVLWELMKDKTRFGGWWPRERPAIFFRPARVKAAFAKAKYDPAYRLPLFQAAFHESVVTTDRWELSPVKFPELVQIREMIELLYNVPSIWSLDLLQLRKHAARLAAHHRFFSAIHRQVGNKPLTEFRWLSLDRRVQQTRFGEHIILTANFGEGDYESVPSMCIEARWLNEGRTELYCPQP